MSKQFDNFKMASVTPPAAIVDNASFTTAEVDTAGWDMARIVVYLGATDIAMAALKVTESNTSASGHADITGAVFGTSTDIDGSTSALPTATDDNKFFVVDLDLRGRKRYLDVVATAGDGSTGTYAAIWCELYRGDAMPSSKTGHGVGGMLRV